MKKPHSKLFLGEYLFPGGNTYLLVNKYCGSSYFSVNNYWGVLLSVEYLFTVTNTSAAHPKINGRNSHVLFLR